MIRLRAHIVIDVDADDFKDAASHQHRVSLLYEAVRTEYGQASLVFRQRRKSAGRHQRKLERGRHHTGRMSEYEE